MSKYPEPKCVEDIAVIFDKEKPGWYEKIDTNTLDLNSINLCPMGQVYGQYNAITVDSLMGRHKGFLGPTNFNRPAWIESINKRKNKVKELTFGEAIALLLQGKKVRAKGWMNKTDHLRYENGKVYLCSSKEWETTFQDLATYGRQHSLWELYEKNKTFADVKPGQRFTFQGRKYTKLNSLETAIDEYFTLTNFKFSDEVE